MGFVWFTAIAPVSVFVDVPYRRERVYEFLDVLANHEPFTDHVMTDWKLSGPERGVGAKAQVSVHSGRFTDQLEIEVVVDDPPRMSRERNIGAGGRRVAYGTYELTELPAGGTRIRFTYSWETAPLSERLLAPLVRASLRKANRRAMQRLAEQLPRALGGTTS